MAKSTSDEERREFARELIKQSKGEIPYAQLNKEFEKKYQDHRLSPRLYAILKAEEGFAPTEKKVKAPSLRVARQAAPKADADKVDKASEELTRVCHKLVALLDEHNIALASFQKSGDKYDINMKQMIEKPTVFSIPTE